MIEIDSLDYLIIQELHQNARISASDIARKFDANERTVRNRIDKLVRENVIRLTAIVNPVKFGYITAADIFLDANPSLEKEIPPENLLNFLKSLILLLGRVRMIFPLKLVLKITKNSANLYTAHSQPYPGSK